MKKEKKLNLPIYDADKQCEYIKQFADFSDIPMPKFLSFILAEWIYTMQEGIIRKNVHPEEALFAFLVRVQDTARKLDELSKEVKNGESK